jgi:hypothetical protein
MVKFGEKHKPSSHHHIGESPCPMVYENLLKELQQRNLFDVIQPIFPNIVSS